MNLKKIKIFTLLKYVYLSGFLVFISFCFNLFLIVYLKYNYNVVFVFSFFFFNILSFLGNSYLTFKNNPNLNKYITYLKNSLFTFISGIIIVNLIDTIYSPKNFILVIFMTFYSSVLNLSLNLNRTFEDKN